MLALFLGELNGLVIISDPMIATCGQGGCEQGCESE
jgi:hypothetical protein